MTPITVHITVTPDYLYRGAVAVNRQIRWRRWVGWFMVLYPAAAVVYWFSATHRLPTSGPEIQSTLALLAMPAFWFLGVPRIERARASRNSRDTPAALGERTFTFTDAGWRYVAGRGNNSYEWSVIVRASESDEAFLLYLNKFTAYYLPKTNFASHGEVAQFRTLLGEKVPVSTG